eukprot:SAG31_NODE_5006_length_2806_cov_2.510898_2_plen_210_part_00
MLGKYVNATDYIAAAAKFPRVRLMTVGNVHDCKEPIIDFYPSGTNDSAHQLYHPWAVASPATVGIGKDVMGGTSCKGPLCFSATCLYYGMELNAKLKNPIGLVHSSYGGSAVEDWISQETLGDGKSGPCPGPITKSMGTPSGQYNGQLRPLLNYTIKGAIWCTRHSPSCLFCAIAVAIGSVEQKLHDMIVQTKANPIMTKTSSTPAATI